MVIRLNIWLAMTVTIGAITSPVGGHAASVAEGGKLAQSLCSRCHVVTNNGQGGWTNAPAFSAIADKPTSTTASLQAFIQQPHMKMLNLQRSPAEAADLAAYIMSLKQQ